MLNKAMERMLESGECLDVEKVGWAMPNWPGHWILPGFKDDEDVDYCVGSTEQWIWSIGREDESGQIVASVEPDLYQNPYYECLWLR